MNRIQHKHTALATPPGAPQVFVFTSGIQVVVRNREGEVSRLYYFRKADDGISRKIVYFHNHTACTPYEFDSCWDMQSKIYLSFNFISAEYKSDNLDKVLYQYYLFDIEIESPEPDEPVRTQCLLKTSNFSRFIDQGIVSELVLQSLPRMEASAGELKLNIASRRRASHHDWLHWKSGETFSIPLNRNGQETGRLRMRSLPGLQRPSSAEGVHLPAEALAAFAQLIPVPHTHSQS